MIKTGLRALALLALIAASLVAAPDYTQAQSPPPQTRTVSGAISNATANGGAVSGVTVTLHRVSTPGSII